MTLPVAETWFHAEHIAPGIVRIDEPHVHPVFMANLYLVEGRDADLVIDSGMGVAPLAAFVAGLRADPAKPLVNVSTHTHIDHMGGAHEFATRLVHTAEAGDLRAPPPAPLRVEGYSHAVRDLCELYPFGDGSLVIDALPHPEFDSDAWAQIPAEPTALLAEGDRVDLGGPIFEVLHLPGHSPGQIALWDAGSGTLFAGDAIYDGELIGEGPGTSIPDYIQTLARLDALPVEIVHGGHGPAFGRARLREIVAEYRALWS